MDEFKKLRGVARQRIETDALLGAEFQPVSPNALPTMNRHALNDSSPREGGVLSGDFPANMTTEEKTAALAAIDAGEVRPCVKCRLHDSRTRTVFGEGSVDAALMFVGEGPGEEEDRQGRPFVGRAGQKLDEMIAAMGLSRRQVYIANVVKCRPPGNRTPMPDEAQTCTALYLIRQFLIIRPRVIVTLGNAATQTLMRTATGITRLRGQWLQLPPWAPALAGVAVMPTFHPSYLLRNYTPQTRQMVWQDLQKVMDRLGLKKKG